MPIATIIDVDTGVDDALALLYAVASPELDLRAVTCVNGNVELDGRHTRGETVADLLQMWRHPLNTGYGLTEAPDNLRLALEVDERTFEARFVKRLHRLVQERA